MQGGVGALGELLWLAALQKGGQTATAVADMPGHQSGSLT